MGKADYYKSGDWNSVCYECGRKFKASTLKLHWQGYYVCPQHWEPRQPQDFVRGQADTQTPPWAQPVPADVFATACYPNDTTAIPNYAIPGCVMPGYINPLSDFA